MSTKILREGAPASAPAWGALAAVLAGLFMSTLDFFIVNVAMPSIQRDLGATSAGIQLIIAGYALAYGSVLITGGRLGDMIGRRRMFILSMAFFTLASAACGLAPSAAFLLVARILQGLAAGFMAPQVLAIIGTVYAGDARARAINAYGTTMGVAAVFGQLLGGLLIKLDLFGLDWRLCFLVNVPIGAIALFLSRRHIVESRSPLRPRLDVMGVVLVTLSLLAVVLPLIEGRQQEWPLWARVSLGASVILLVVLVFHQRRLGARGGFPLIDMRLFREKAFSVGLIAQLVFWMGQASYFLVLAYYMQGGRGLDALGAGMVFGAIGAGYMASSSAARIIAARMGRQTIALGGILRAAGLALLLIIVSRVGVGGPLAALIPALVIDGAGMGLAIAPLAGTVLSRVRPEHAGTASGILSTGVQVGNAFGISLIGIFFYGVLGRAGTSPGVYAHAFSVSLMFLIAVGVVLALLVQFLPRKA